MTLLWRWINVIDDDSTSQQRKPTSFAQWATSDEWLDFDFDFELILQQSSIVEYQAGGRERGWQI